MIRRYQEAKEKGKDNYDRELEDVIERLIIECDRKIQRALKRLEDDDAKAAIAIAVSEVTQSPEIVEFSKQIKEKLKEADDQELEGKTSNRIKVMEQVEEIRAKQVDKQAMLLLEAFNKDRALMPQPIQNAPPMAPFSLLLDARTQEMIIEKVKRAGELGELGMVDEAQKVMEEAEALKKLGARQEPTPNSTKYTYLDVCITNQKIHVCNICGAFLSVTERGHLAKIEID